MRFPPCPAEIISALSGRGIPKILNASGSLNCFSFFVFLPFLLGYILGNSIIRSISIAGLAFSLLVFFILLIAGNLEGMVCILMALPLLILAVALGWAMNYLIRGNKKKDYPEDLIHSSLLPFVAFVCVGFIQATAI